MAAQVAARWSLPVWPSAGAEGSTMGWMTLEVVVWKRPSLPQMRSGKRARRHTARGDTCST